MKFDVDKFDGNNSFSLSLLLCPRRIGEIWMIKLFQLSVLICLSNEVLVEKTVSDLWSKLENLYLTKSLTN
ncbi:hypothetical protein CFOL_v3_06368, partial [Cephalotus follicularis]